MRERDRDRDTQREEWVGGEVLEREGSRGRPNWSFPPFSPQHL